MAYAGTCSGRRRPLIGLSPGFSWLQALALELIGGPMTRDNLRSMSVPNICDAGCGLPFGLAAAALEQIAPGYLGRPSR